MPARRRTQHKWLGLTVGVLLLLFCLSGIVLNHRHLFANVNISRVLLPSSYQYHKWNNGLLRGTISLRDSTILIYGKEGVFSGRWRKENGKWITENGRWKAEEGFPKGADYRSISNIVETKNGDIYAAAQFGLYKRIDNSMYATSAERCEYIEDVHWQNIPLDMDDDDRLTDVTAKGDTVIVLSRSKMYIAVGNDNFKAYSIKTPAGGLSKSMFHFIMQLHSGALLGLPGRLIADAIAITFIILFVTGIVLWRVPKRIKAINRANPADKEGRLSRLRDKMRHNRHLHEHIGRHTIIVTVLIAVTGAFLRPPLLIAVARLTMPTSGSDGNAWEDKLRMLQWDDRCDDWLLSTSEGFYTMKELGDVPQSLASQPPVSIMGINVMKHTKDGSWLIGSFSGLYRWYRQGGKRDIVTDALTGKRLTEKPLPFGNLAVSGYSDDFGKPFYCTYYEGTDALLQPAELTDLPMSLWNVALEVHTGRIFTFLGDFGAFLYIFFMGILTVWLLATGYKLGVRS